ncbi:MAG: leucine-rich repeat domain-containing protein [Mycoplasmoidaceae bacterium]|nr:leucine-rich repeat domain-containing protein [Mycoplasmoidaceae bacterium]
MSSIADGEFSYDSSESVQIGINDDNSASILDCNVNSISVNNLSFHSSFIDSDGVTHPITIIGESAFSSQTESFVPDISGKVSFPNSIISIGKNAFYKCQKITELDIIDATSLTYIDAGAFAKCIGISGKISFPSSLQQIYDNETSYGSFYQCRNITELDFSMCENLKSIGSYSFFGCSSISNDIYFPKTLETIGSYSFSQCSSLRSINFPSDSSLKTIDDSAFSECKLLSIPDFSPCLNLLLIGNSSFYDCSNMIGVLSIPVNIKTIGVSAFSKTNINYLWLY